MDVASHDPFSLTTIVFIDYARLLSRANTIPKKTKKNHREINNNNVTKLLFRIVFIKISYEYNIIK